MTEKGKYFPRHSYNKGENNPNWRGGIAEYPDHYLMKKVRLEVLEEANYTCYYCGNKANEIHHKDQTKNNHSKENFEACCHGCNHLRENTKPHKPHTSHYKRLYGFTARELNEMGFLKDIQMMQKNWNYEGYQPIENLMSF